MITIRVWIGLVVVVASSLVGDWVCRSAAHGLDQDRLIRVAGECVAQLPECIGKWHSSELERFSDRLLGTLHCGSYLNRSYVDEETGEAVAMMLLVGPAGPMVAHTPEVCYESTNYGIVESSRAQAVRAAGDREDTFNRVVFESKGVGAERMSVHYAWRRTDGPWVAPANPRLTLGGQPLLFKLQLSVVDRSSESSTPGPDRRFLADLLPELDRILIVR